MLGAVKYLVDFSSIESWINSYMYLVGSGGGAFFHLGGLVLPAARRRQGGRGRSSRGSLHLAPPSVGQQSSSGAERPLKPRGGLVSAPRLNLQNLQNLCKVFTVVLAHIVLLGAAQIEAEVGRQVEVGRGSLRLSSRKRLGDCSLQHYTITHGHETPVSASVNTTHTASVSTTHTAHTAHLYWGYRL